MPIVHGTPPVETPGEHTVDIYLVDISFQKICMHEFEIFFENDVKRTGLASQVIITSLPDVCFNTLAGGEMGASVSGDVKYGS